MSEERCELCGYSIKSSCMPRHKVGLQHRINALTARNAELETAIRSEIDWLEQQEQRVFRHRSLDDGVLYTPFREVTPRLRKLLDAKG